MSRKIVIPVGHCFPRELEVLQHILRGIGQPFTTQANWLVLPAQYGGSSYRLGFDFTNRKVTSGIRTMLLENSALLAPNDEIAELHHYASQLMLACETAYQLCVEGQTFAATLVDGAIVLEIEHIAVAALEDDVLKWCNPRLAMTIYRQGINERHNADKNGSLVSLDGYDKATS